MGDESDALKQHIDETRAELDKNIDQLQENVKRAFDWRVQFEEHTLTMVAIAFGIGVLASVIGPSRRRRR
jgi:translation elongation factor EF-1beta